MQTSLLTNLVTKDEVLKFTVKGEEFAMLNFLPETKTYSAMVFATLKPKDRIMPIAQFTKQLSFNSSQKRYAPQEIDFFD